MNLTPDKIALIAAAAVVFLWPTISPAIKQFLAGMQRPAPQEPDRPSAPRSRPVGSDPADWIVDLMALKKVLEANNQNDAASLLSQAMVKILAAKDSSGGGSKR